MAAVHPIYMQNHFFHIDFTVEVHIIYIIIGCVTAEQHHQQLPRIEQQQPKTT